MVWRNPEMFLCTTAAVVLPAWFLIPPLHNRTHQKTLITTQSNKTTTKNGHYIVKPGKKFGESLSADDDSSNFLPCSTIQSLCCCVGLGDDKGFWWVLLCNCGIRNQAGTTTAVAVTQKNISGYWSHGLKKTQYVFVCYCCCCCCTSLIPDSTIA